MLAYVIAHIKFFDFSILDELDEHFFKEVFKMADGLFENLLRNFLPYFFKFSYLLLRLRLELD